MDRRLVLQSVAVAAAIGGVVGAVGGVLLVGEETTLVAWGTLALAVATIVLAISTLGLVTWTRHYVTLTRELVDLQRQAPREVARRASITAAMEAFGAYGGRVSTLGRQLTTGLIRQPPELVYSDVHLDDVVTLSNVLIAGAGTVGGDLGVRMMKVASDLDKLRNGVIGVDVAVRRMRSPDEIAEIYSSRDGPAPPLDALLSGAYCDALENACVDLAAKFYLELGGSVLPNWTSPDEPG